MEVVRIFEPGSQGARGVDGNSILPSGVISGSIQIASDISGSFTSVSASFSSRIGTYDSKTLFSSSQQVIYSSIQGIPSSSLTGSGTNTQIGIFSGSNFITGSGNLVWSGSRLGIGTESPDGTIEVKGDDVNPIFVGTAGNGTKLVEFNEDGIFKWYLPGSNFNPTLPLVTIDSVAATGRGRITLKNNHYNPAGSAGGDVKIENSAGYLLLTTAHSTYGYLMAGTGGTVGQGIGSTGNYTFSTFSASRDHIFYNNNFTGETMRIKGSGRVYISENLIVTGSISGSSQLLTIEDSATATVSFPQKISHTSTGIVSASFGVGQQFELENASGSNVIAGTQEFTFTDPITGSEDVDYTLKLIRAGTLTTSLTVTSAGVATFGSTVISGGDVFAVSTSRFRWSSRSTLGAPSNGVITLFNNAATDFDRLQFGGTTSSFPSIKRSGTGLIARLADDSADAPLTASNLISTATVRLQGYTVATLPAGVIGDMVYVTDALAPTYGATAVGGGAVVTPCFFDGTNWTTR